MSPSCPNDVLTVGKANAAVNDFTVSDAIDVIVVSKTTCGGWLFLTESMYREHTAQTKIHRSNVIITEM